MTAPERQSSVIHTSRTGRPDPRTPNGNAPYGSRMPRLRDRALAFGLRAVVPLWRCVGLRMGAASLRHYLVGRGAPFVIDPTQPLRAKPFRRAALTHFEEWWALAAIRWHDSGGLESVFETTTHWHGVLIRRGDDTDWWLAMRGLQYRITGRIEVLPGTTSIPGSPVLPDVRLVYRVEVYKDWGFDKGQGEYGVSFTPLARLHEVGLAREFPVTGRSGDLVWTSNGPHGCTDPSTL
ncbi:hypothetical protein OG948_12710 [Embleya sp. NBC_00888]|jgi:hypothetical protein|uniref:hypothetical protein n=1 Tax=Embleya sp. NBC_00888 TaxID=2975960 RepID=UPI00386A2AAC|nr:hypothetical protein OG948_12710 [Embleya sp. NBC_00888]